MIDRDVGELFEFEGARYRVIEGDPCEGCAFLHDSSEDGCYAVGLCSGDVRSDGISVVVEEIDD